MKTTTFFLATIVTISLLALSSQAQTYRVSYDHYVFATGSADPPVMDDGNLIGQATLYNEFTHLGEPLAPNYGYVKYFANIHTGSVGAYAYCTGAVDNFWPYGFTATARVEQIGFEARLVFEVPPGTYPDGVTVGMNGCVNGAMSASIEASAKSQYTLVWGGTSLNAPIKAIGDAEDRAIYFTEPFNLTHQIVSDGAVLPDTQTYNVLLRAILNNCETSATLGGTSPNYTTGSAMVNMYTGIQLTSITYPDGVTWTVEDDVFLDELTGAESEEAPAAIRLEQNYPNPFNPSTTIAYNLPGPSIVELRVYDVSGRLVRTLQNGIAGEDRHEVVWDGRDDSGRAVASGVYFYRLVAGTHSETRKMLLLK
jgi:hypothetical protein